MNSLNIALLLARLVLAVVFLVSGVSKLADLAGSPRPHPRAVRAAGLGLVGSRGCLSPPAPL